MSFRPVLLGALLGIAAVVSVLYGLLIAAADAIADQEQVL